MKNFIYFILISISILSCNKDDENKQSESLIGKWQLFEEYIVNGVDGGWIAVTDDNSYMFQLNEDSTFVSSKYNECTIGTFLINGNELTFNYSCEGFTLGFETPEGIFIESFTLTENILYLTPNYMSCDEGCGSKFIKITEE